MFDPAGPVLGIDPGVSRCGYGVVARAGSSLRALSAGVIRTQPSDPLPERLRILDDELGALIAQVRPSALVVERVLFQANVRTAMHPTSSCAMGADEMAVVDGQLRVRGLSGLRVADASIMPVIVGGNTNAPTIMIAEKAVDLIRGNGV